MTTAFLSHPDCLLHQTPEGHPERPARLQLIDELVKSSDFAALHREEAPLATEADLRLAHPAEHIATIQRAAPDAGIAQIESDTYLSPGSYTAALRAAGANMRAVDLVLSGQVQNAFCATRPPGHHAESQRPMGFCLFGNAVIAAKHALERHNLHHVAIVDFDVHHGNGTQDLVWEDDRILFISTHEMPLYPGTGTVSERGARNNVLNIPLTSGGDGADIRRAFDIAMPRLEAFIPDLIIISAGFDAHNRDPLAGLNWTGADFGDITRLICDVAARTCQGRVVSTLEGGYDLQGLADGVAAHLNVLMEQ